MIKLRQYQQQAVDAFNQYYCHNNDNGLIVLPTASGKSVVIGKLIADIAQSYNHVRILLLSHVGELIEQNHSKIKLCWNNAPAGIYSDKLKKKQAHFPIVSGTIQSVYKKAQLLGHRDICIIDECHLINSSNSGMYRSLFNALKEINPNLIICGFTASDWRTDSGLLTDGDLFNTVIYELPLSYMLEEGYITPPIDKSMLSQADMKGVKITAGEFNIKQQGERFDEKEFMEAAIKEDLPYLQDRKSIALFCATVENAKHVAEAMSRNGIECETLDGEMSKEVRDDKLDRFRNGSLRAIASVGVITTGTDIPNIDCIILFRATQSSALLYQIIGRGFRVMYADGYDIETRQGRHDAIRYGVKPNFLILDHGGNIERHGGILHIQKPKAKIKGERAPVRKTDGRICEVCRTWYPKEIVICQQCGNKLFEQRDPTANLSITASDASVINGMNVAKWVDVLRVSYQKYQKAGGRPTLQIIYHTKFNEFKEWIAVNYLEKWQIKRIIEGSHIGGFDFIIDNADNYKTPKRIQILKKDKYFEVVNYEF